MSDLTDERLAYQTQALANTGVEYFELFYVTVCRATKNSGDSSSVVLLLLPSTQIATSMDTSPCGVGVERFVSRRNTPAMIWSDSGKWH